MELDVILLTLRGKLCAVGLALKCCIHSKGELNKTIDFIKLNL